MTSALVALADGNNSLLMGLRRERQKNGTST